VTERKPGSMRLRANPAPATADADAKVALAESVAEPSKEPTMTTEEEVPVANGDEAEVPRSVKKCNDCSWSQSFTLFGSCGAKA